MIEKILEKIETLPPLPQTVIEIQEYKRDKNKDVEKLIAILQKDALCVTTLLKIANSSFFGFNSKIETLSRVVNLLGVDFTLSIVIAESINSVFQPNLSPYNVNCEDFMKVSYLSSNLVNLWVSKIDIKMKDEILFANLLQEIGKFILSEMVINRGLEKDFEKKIDVCNDISLVEKEFLEITTSEVSAQILKFWGFSPNFIQIIEFIDNIEKCKNNSIKKTQILDVVKTICDIRNPFSDENIAKGIEKAVSYQFEEKLLVEAIDKLKDRISKEV